MGEKIREARQEAGLTQAELAERVHLRQAATSQIECGQMMLDVETLVYLAGVVEKPIRYFFPDRLLPPLEREPLNRQRQYLENLRKLTPMDRHRVAEYVGLLAKARVYEERELKQRLKEQIQETGIQEPQEQPEPESDTRGTTLVQDRSSESSGS